MFCRNCGSEIDDGAMACMRCGTPVTPGPPVTQVPNHLVGAILCTIFCCQIFGIVSIVYAAQVNGRLAAGDVQGAMDLSKKAETWMWWGVWLSVAVNLIVLAAAMMKHARTF